MMDNAIVYYYPIGHQAHAAPQHPERPERIDAISEALRESSWWDDYPKISPVNLPEEVLFAIHQPEYIKLLQDACQAGDWYDQDTYLTPDSLKIALGSAGGAIAVARAVWDLRSQTGFALSRPPGHHALPDRAMGFCLLNNVALAAEDLIQSRAAKRIAIIDIDLHHGNGTQEIFWKRGDVFYFSMHQWPLYPYTGRLEDTGTEKGAGRTANLPFPAGTGDEGYEGGLRSVFVPLLDRYKPEMLLISAGFDAHWMDPLGFIQLSAQGYYNIIRLLKGWADRNCEGRMALVLEGGYNLRATAVCACACVAALLGLNWQDPLGQAPYRANDRWKELIQQAIKLWDL